MRLAPWLPPALVLAHVVFGLLRVPRSVVAKRLAQVAAVEQEGYVPYLFRAAHLEGADAVLDLSASTPPHALIVTRGPLKGALEFAPALLWPRLCLRDGAVLPDDGRPVAGRALVGDRDGLWLEPR